MNINTIDIIIIVLVIVTGLIELKSDFIKNICQTVNLILSLILTSLIIKNLSIQFKALSNTQETFFLSVFILIYIVLLFLIGFLIEFSLEQINQIYIDKYLEYVCNLILGMIKGFIFITFILFIFESIPISSQSRDTIYNKIEKKSLMLKPCYNLKNILFQQ